MFRLAVLACFCLTTLPLSAQSSEFGAWKSLFNGHDTSGWMLAKPSDPKRANQRTNSWKAENGTLTNGGPGKNDLCTVDSFRDYELELEYKIPPGGNSGVYLRGQIEIQVFDSHGKSDEQLQKVDAGAIYGGEFVALRSTQYPPGQWNKYRVLHVGNRITAWHNDVLIQDNVYTSSRTGGAMDEHGAGNKLTSTREGPVMLQGDHGHVWYRNLRIRPLFTSGSGWKPIWNGKDLSQFNAHKKDINALWEVENNAFTNTKHGSEGTDIWTNGEYGNFLVYYCYKSDPNADGGNSGFYLRNQWELQIFSTASLVDSHRDGALYSIHPVLATARHGVNQWNHMFVKVAGQKIWAWQNGQLIHAGRVCETRTDNHGRPTPNFSKDAFKIQGDHGKVAFSALWIKELPDSQPAGD